MAGGALALPDAENPCAEQVRAADAKATPDGSGSGLTAYAKALGDDAIPAGVPGRFAVDHVMTAHEQLADLERGRSRPPAARRDSGARGQNGSNTNSGQLASRP